MKIKIFSKLDCKYCTLAKEFLKKNDIQFEDTPLDRKKDLLKILELKKETHQITFPFIFDDEHFIGGHEDLKEYIKTKVIFNFEQAF